MELKQEGEKLSGNFDGDKLEGTLKGSSIYFLAKDEQGGTDEGKATVQGGTITGTVVFTHADDAAHPEVHKFTAEVVPAGRGGKTEGRRCAGIWTRNTEWPRRKNRRSI